MPLNVFQDRIFLIKYPQMQEKSAKGILVYLLSVPYRYKVRALIRASDCRVRVILQNSRKGIDHDRVSPSASPDLGRICQPGCGALDRIIEQM